MKLLRVAVAMIAAACAFDASAAFIRTIEAPGGVGNVTSLTNVLTEFNALSTDDRKNARIWLQPGIYNLSGIYMNSASHLRIEQSTGGLFAGLGDGPGDTILLGGGESQAHRVLSCSGGGNYGSTTISNLTCTGGWTTSNGGGVEGSASVTYRCLIISNNYAVGSGNGAGGGGCFKGQAYNCLFADNHTTERWGGGLLVDGYYTRNETVGQGAWNCVFVGNTAKQYGGGLSLKSGQCHGCSFTNNSATGAGGAIHVYQVDYTTWSGIPRTTQISGCTFSGNNVAVHSAPAKIVSISNCVFRFNSGGHTVWHGDLVDSTIECNTNGTGVVGNSAMNRCVVRNNAVRNRYASGIDYCETDAVHYTNVNCLVESNGYLDEYGKVLLNKSYVNCTIVGNYMPNGGNYGYLERGCTFWNCVLFDNKISTSTKRDVRTMDKDKNPLAVCMTNCMFATSDIAAGSIGVDGAVTHDGLGNCRQLAKSELKLVDEPNGDYTPSTRSPLYDKGLADDWIVDLVGYRDLAGGRRIFGGGLDIGAYECQLDKPGMMLIFR